MSTKQRKLAALMFIDIVGYSASAQKNETLTLDLLEEYRNLLRPLFPTYGGRIIDTAGDGFFVEFDSALEAARCASEIQKILHERNFGKPLANQIRIRIGLHLGDVVHMGENVHGDKVNIAARIMPLAEPGGICISEDMARQIQNQSEIPVLKLGKGELKNIALPMQIYRIVLPWEKRRLAISEQLRFNLQRKRIRRFVLGFLAVFVFIPIFVLVGWYTAILWQGTKEKKGHTATITKQEAPQEVIPLDKHRIAILPFVNLSADAENEYFSDGMTEELISQLSKISRLEVIARTSVMKYKGKEKDIAEIGRELKVGTVLEGSVRKAENQVRITVQLINVQNQAHLWSQDYDRELKGIFTIQSNIAQRVAEALQVQLLAGEKQRIEKKGTENLEGYNLYLKGRYYLSKQTREGLKKSIEYFTQAIEKDPAYALAYAGIADSYTLLGLWTYLPIKEVAPKAKAAAQKSLELDATLAEAYTPLAVIKMLYDWDWPGAEREFKRALAFNLGYAMAHTDYPIYFMYMGRHDEAIAEIQRAQELDPLSLSINTLAATILTNARRFDQAIEQAQKIIEMDPNFFVGHYWLAYAYMGKGMYEEAITEYKKAIDLSGGTVWPIALLGHTYGRLGRRDEALQVLNELQERSKREQGYSVFQHSPLPGQGEGQGEGRFQPAEAPLTPALSPMGRGRTEN
jgi:TolB-like protein/class 3 adenylate cyclase/Tfp pilus assembly protein PilF